MKESTSSNSFPNVKEIEDALELEKGKEVRRYISKKTLSLFVILIAVLILLIVWCLPLVKIDGSSMAPTLHNGDIILTTEKESYRAGDIIIFKYGNSIITKRIIASGGDSVSIDTDGNVYVNNRLIQEDYLVEKALGECEIEFPYQVPEDTFFVLGDHRSTSADSRILSIGTVSEDDIIGMAVLKIWPLGDFDVID